jgi:aminopeptidase YwaD
MAAGVVEETGGLLRNGSRTSERAPMVSIRFGLSSVLLATALFSSASSACHGDGAADGSGAEAFSDGTLESRVMQTLNELAAFGNKRAGTDEDEKAAHYLEGRWQKAGLTEVHFETFTFPKFELASSSLSIGLDGAGAAPMTHEVFAYSGTGQADADIAYVGKGHPTDYDGKDVTGKIVLVDHDDTFHRTAQLALVAQHGGVAMLWASTAPNDLIQVGAASLTDGQLGPAPAISISATDAKKIRDAVTAKKSAHAAVVVKASTRPAQGRNLVGTLAGSDPSGAYIVVGAHYDTWFTGSFDNGTGVAATVAIAEDLAQRGGRKLGLRFVAYDAEEVGLFGGYDYLRKHVVLANEPMLGFVNLEEPANHNDGRKVIAHTNGSSFGAATTDPTFQSLVPINVPLDVLPPAFGGVIPTDIQGMYRFGLQGTSTFAESPFYHTNADTPDKVDAALLAGVTTHIEAALDVLDKSVPASFDIHDPKLWKPAITTSLGADHKSVVVNVVVKDDAGNVQPGATVDGWIDIDDFIRFGGQTAVADPSGTAQLTFSLDDSVTANASSWLHVTTGKTYPLSESVTAITRLR